MAASARLVQAGAGADAGPRRGGGRARGKGKGDAHAGDDDNDDGRVLGTAWAARPSQAAASMARGLVDAAVEAAAQGRARGKVPLQASKQETQLRKRLLADQRENGGALVVTGAKAVSVYTAEDWVCLKSWSVSADGRALASPAQIVPGTSTLVALDEDNQLLQWDYFQEGLQLPEQGSAALGPTAKAAPTPNGRGRNKRGAKKSKRTVAALVTSPALIGLYVAVYSDGAMVLRSNDSEIASAAAPDAQGDDDDEETRQGRVLSAQIVRVATSLWRILCTEIVPGATAAAAPSLRVRSLDLHPHGFGFSRAQTVDVGSADVESLIAAVPSSTNRISFAWKDGFCAAAALSQSSHGEAALAVPVEVPGAQRTITCCDAVPSAESGIALLGAGQRLVAWDASLGVELGSSIFKDDIVDVCFAAPFQSHVQEGGLVALVLGNGEVYVDFLGGLAPEDGAFVAVTRPSRLVDAAERRRMRKRPRATSSGALAQHGDVSALLAGSEAADTGAWADALATMRADAESSSANGGPAASSKKKKKKRGAAADEDTAEGKSGLDADPEVANLSVEYVRNRVAALIRDEDWAQLEEAIREGIVSVSTNPEVLSALMRAEKVMLLYLCIIYVNDLGEGDMVRILRFAMATCSPRALAAFTKEVKKIIKSIPETKETVAAAISEYAAAKKKLGATKKKIPAAKREELSELHRAVKKASQNADRKAHYERVFSFHAELSDDQKAVVFLTMAVMCSIRNEIFLVRAARTLPGLCISSLVEGAASLLIFYEGLPLKSREYLYNPRSYKGSNVLLIPSASHVMSWTSALLDAGLKPLVEAGAHSEDTRKTLERIAALARESSAFTEKLNALHQPLRFCLRMNRDFVPPSAVGDYAVETVTF